MRATRIQPITFRRTIPILLPLISDAPDPYILRTHDLMNPTPLTRRVFFRHAATLAAVTAAGTPASVLAAKPVATRYPYLGRTRDYTDFQLIDSGRTITKIESWTQGKFMAAIPNPGPYVEFSIEENPNANESLYAPALRVINGKVKIPDAPGWGFTPNPNWIAKASYLVSERPSKP